MRTYTLDGKKLPLKGDAKPACETCRFWRQAEGVVGRGDKELRECRRRAPTAVQFAQTQDGEGDGGARGNALAVFPETWLDDWCGEYEEAAQAVN